MNKDLIKKCVNIETDEVMKIELANPISIAGINNLIISITSCENRDSLLINFGNHEFETITALKYCKFELLKIEKTLLEFRKIAFVTPSLHGNENTNNLSWFYTEKDAMEWIED